LQQLPGFSDNLFFLRVRLVLLVGAVPLFAVSDGLKTMLERSVASIGEQYTGP
jgi:hypothetical protein